MKDFRQRAFVGLIGLVSAGLLSVGCSSSSNTTGSGGSNGSGGSHTGGSTGTGTGGTLVATGGAGGGASTGLTCGPSGTGTTAAPAAMLITDFSDATSSVDGGVAKIMFGTSSTVQGGATTFQDGMSSAGTANVTGGALAFMASVAAPTATNMYPYNGVVVYINGPSCVDASQYTGVSFSISGNVGMCGLVFSINDAQHGDSTTGADARFTGPKGSYAPQLSIGSMVTSTKTTIQVPFTDTSFANGSPAFSTSGIDPKDVTGVQWQFTIPTAATAPCTGSITVDDVTFYK